MYLFFLTEKLKNLQKYIWSIFAFKIYLKDEVF